jgi:hypothetical protein
MSIPISPHFTLREFACHDGTPYPVDNLDESGKTWLLARLKPLCEYLEILRATLGGASITILSGYRSPAHNVQVGGAKASQHMAGRAADITVNGFAPSDVYKTLLQLHNEGKIQIGGLGVYPGWCHVDVRPWPGHLALWRGTGVGSEIT